MNIKLLYFGRPREILGLTEEQVTLPDNAKDMRALLDHLGARGGNWAQELAATRVRCAVNQTLGGLDTPIRNGDEVAIFSPISGG